MFWSKEDVQSDQISSLEFSAQMNLKQSQMKPEEFHTWTYDIRVYISSLKRHIFYTKLLKYD